MKVYVDTSAFLAILNADDEFHSKAAMIWHDLLTDATGFITNSFVLVEINAFIAPPLLQCTGSAFRSLSRLTGIFANRVLKRSA